MQTTLLPLSAIITPPERQRMEFDSTALLELAMSIQSHGLFHAIQVRPDGRTLVSGERRLRAISEHLVPFNKGFQYNGELIPPGCVPVVVASSSDPLVLEEIELAENVQRKDLTWQEMAKTTARLHALRQAQNPIVVRMSSESNPTDPILNKTFIDGSTHTVADTAKEVRGSAIGSYQEDTRKEIILAKHLDKPEIAGAANLKDAFKALKRIEEGARNRALAIAVGETYRSDQHEIYNANCLEWMAQEANAGRFDVILTDPPYGMNAQDFGDGDGRLDGIEHHYDDSYETWKPLMRDWAILSFVVTKPEAHAYVWCDIDRFHELKLYMQLAGWYVFRTPLTNYKQNSGRVPLPDQGPRRQSEWCLYAIKGKKRTNMIASDVIVTQSDEQMSHGAQKPVALYEELLRRSVKPGDTLLDSFGGTGPLIPAAHTYKCKAVVIEQNPTYYGLCAARLKAVASQLELPE